MLKDAYRKKMDSVHVRDGLLDEMKMESVQRSRDERAKKDRRRGWMIAIPTFAAAAAACIAIFVGVNAGGKEEGRIASAEAPANAAIASESVQESKGFLLGQPKSAEVSVPTTVGSYEELGRIMEERTVRNGYSGVANGGIDMAVAEDAVEAPAAAEPMEAPAPMPQTNAVTESVSMKGSDESGRRYSGTNVQVEGVDEADIVKTDGTWIYAMSRSQNKIYILAAEGSDTKTVSTIKLREPSGKDTFWRYYSEMMLCGDRLYLLGTHNDWSEKVKDQDRTNTFAEVYDLGDRTAPKLVTTHKQQGDYRTARLVDGMLVIVSDYRLWYWYSGVDQIPVREYVPKVVTNDKETPLAPDDIYVNPESKENGFTVVTTINALDGKEFDSHKAVLGGCNTVYCSGTDLLIAAQEWRSEQSEEQTDANGKHFVKILSGADTNLFRFTLIDGKVEAAASAKIPGTLLNQFSMDAYNGYYRVVVTRSESEETIWTDGIDTYEWNSSSDCALFVLDGSLNTVGRIEDLAKDERVQSVRFMGDTAYFVTFRQVDPLFSADLSDPENPKILSTLKIQGFSAYLHPFGEGKLLGIGYDADEERGWTENVKLSMFDISDPADVKEAFKLSVKDANWTSVQYNHKIVFVDVETGTIAFPADDVYLVFRAEGDAFKQIGTIRTESEYWLGDARGLFIDDVFYVVGDSEVIVLSFETMEKIATIKLK